MATTVAREWTWWHVRTTVVALELTTHLGAPLPTPGACLRNENRRNERGAVCANVGHGASVRYVRACGVVVLVYCAEFADITDVDFVFEFDFRVSEFGENTNA